MREDAGEPDGEAGGAEGMVHGHYRKPRPPSRALLWAAGNVTSRRRQGRWLRNASAANIVPT